MFELFVSILEIFFGCGCLLLMCIDFRVGVGIGPFGCGIVFMRCLGGDQGLGRYLCVFLGFLGHDGCMWLWL